jgi:uncharacterized protein (TIGR03084 family)
MAETLQSLVDDLAAEQEVLRSLLSTLEAAAWDRESPAEGWTLRDCVAHLAETDESATAIVQGRSLERRGERQAVLSPGQVRARSLAAGEVRAWYSRAAAELVAALRDVSDEDRITWAGRPMSARSYVTARLMEHWSHGLDIQDAAGVAPVDTDRLRHIAQLGYLTRDFAYRNRGLTPPSTPLRVELAAPSGDVWTYGPPDAPDRISGTPGDFCRVVTQRIHPADTGLRCEGPHAAEFLGIAQAFAGPPGSGRQQRKGRT